MNGVLARRASNARLYLLVSAVLTIWLLGIAWAHQSLLFAHVTTRPAIPVAGEAFALSVRVTDSSHRQVSGVNLLARLDVDGADSDRSVDAREPVLEAPLRATSGSGEYRGRFEAMPSGVYRLTLIEVDDGRSKASATGNLSVGGSSAVDLQLLLPPSGQGRLGTWLVWLVGLPVLAGLLVTVLVLTGRDRSEQP